MHYQENCARYNWITMSWWNQRQSTELSLERPTGNFSWTELGKSTKMRGKLLCSGVGIKNRSKHRVQIRRYWHNLRPNVEELRSLRCKQRKRTSYGTVISVLEHFAVVTDKCCILWYVMVVNVLFVLNKYLQNRVFQMILHIVLLLLKIKSKYIYKKKNCVWLSNIINKDFGCRWIWNYNDPRWEVISTSDSVLGRYYFSPRVIIISYPPQPKSIFVY